MYTIDFYMYTAPCHGVPFRESPFACGEIIRIVHVYFDSLLALEWLLSAVLPNDSVSEFPTRLAEFCEDVCITNYAKREKFVFFDKM